MKRLEKEVEHRCNQKIIPVMSKAPKCETFYYFFYREQESWRKAHQGDHCNVFSQCASFLTLSRAGLCASWMKFHF